MAASRQEMHRLPTRAPRAHRLPDRDCGRDERDGPTGNRGEIRPHTGFNRPHGRDHITPEYRADVLAGPFRSEDDLRELAAEEGISVLQNYRAVFNGHHQRWLVALEIGDDDAMVKHGRAMDGMLWRIGQLTREIAPCAGDSTELLYDA
jgi:hypothetical protein